MTTHIAEAAGSWRTRLGVLLVLLVATLGVVFALQQRAEADVPSVVIEVDDPAAPVDGGGTFAYTIDFDFTAAGNATSPASFRFTHDEDLIFQNDAFSGGGWGDFATGDCRVTNPTTVICTGSVGGNPAWADGTLTLNFLVNPAGGKISPPTLGLWNCRLADSGAGVAHCADANGDLLARYQAANAVSVDPGSATNALGLAETFTFTLPAGYTCQGDDDTTPERECSVADVNAPGLTILSGPTPTGDWNEAGTVTVTVVAGTPGVYSVSLNVALVEVALDGGVWDVVEAFVSDEGIKTYVAAELRHMDGGTVITAQDVPNNVRGHRHTVCVVAADTGIDLNGDRDFTDYSTDFREVAPSPLQIPLTSFNQINVTAGGGHTAITDPDPTFTDPMFFTGDGTNGLENASCFSWISTEAGDQELTVEYDGDDGNTYTVRWDDDGDNNDNDDVDNDGPSNGALIKQWNVLEDSTVTVLSDRGWTALGSGTGSNDSPSSPTVEINRAAIFNPANSTYDIGVLTVSDKFNGSHVMRTGATWSTKTPGNPGLWGVNVSVYLATACGTVNGGNPTLSSPLSLGATGPAGTEGFMVAADDSCGLNDSIVVVITGQEPGPLGSGAGRTVTQVVKINLVAAVPTKQVFLAWAGQRVILEHDWRIWPGDGDGVEDDDPGALGLCPFGDNSEGEDDDESFFLVEYIKGSGPGNFLPGPHVLLIGSDHANVVVSTEENQIDEQVPNAPWENCISRVLYESEDQGQVDIEAFVYGVAYDFYSEEDFYTMEGVPFPDEWEFSPLVDNQTKIAFVIYYMKIESVETSLVTSVEKPAHNSSDPLLNDWAPGNPWDASADEFATEWNVSKDLLVRVRVKGWFTNSNPSGRPQEQKNASGDFLPANRWVMPDDWAVLAGGEAGIQFRPEYDLMIGPDSGLALALPELAVGMPFEGPYSLLDTRSLTGPSAALSDFDPNNVRKTMFPDGKINTWDAPMPPLMVAVDIRGAGFIKEVLKEDVYYKGTPNSVTTQTYPNPYYIQDIPASPFIPANVAGGGYFWDTWGNDGPGCTPSPANFDCTLDGVNGQGVYRFWRPIGNLIATAPGKNWAGFSDTSVTAAQVTELNAIRTAYGDNTIGRTLVIYTDNHGEGMVAANGDFKLTYSGCAVNPVYGTPHCDTGDVVGSSSIFATGDYPDFRGKHPPVQSFSAVVDWTWGGYKDVTVEDGETEQFKYVVLHVKDRDGFCSIPADAVSLHPVVGEEVDFLIDGGQGKIVDSAQNGTLSGERGAADGVLTFSTALNTTLKEFPTLDGSADECQAWIKVSSSLLDIVNVLVTAHDPEGKVGFDVLVDFTSTFQYQLTFRWSLITWVGADGISPEAALKGEGANAGGTNIFDKVTALYGWNQSAQAWLGFFPAAMSLPGVNDLTALQTGVAYWIAVTENTAWPVITDVN